jgi:hypothetical protein
MLSTIDTRHVVGRYNRVLIIMLMHTAARVGAPTGEKIQRTRTPDTLCEIKT